MLCVKRCMLSRRDGGMLCVKCCMLSRRDGDKSQGCCD